MSSTITALRTGVQVRSKLVEISPYVMRAINPIIFLSRVSNLLSPLHTKITYSINNKLGTKDASSILVPYHLFFPPKISLIKLPILLINVYTVICINSSGLRK